MVAYDTLPIKVVKMSEGISPPHFVPRRTLLKEVNNYLTCYLCRGYYIDATAIMECLHSFCRSCIIQQLLVKCNCPICGITINAIKPDIKSDKTLQDIVYKLVPGLYQKEMRQRRLFYASRPDVAAKTTPEQRGEETERIIFSPEDIISFSLEHVDVTDNANILKNSLANNKQTPKECFKRFLQCAALVNISNLKRFLCMKFDFDMSQYYFEILYRSIPLPEYYTLMDVAYIYNWKRTKPIRFSYKIIKIDLRNEYNFIGNRKEQINNLEKSSLNLSGEKSSHMLIPKTEINNVDQISINKSQIEDVEKFRFLNSIQLTATINSEPKNSTLNHKNKSIKDATPKNPDNTNYSIEDYSIKRKAITSISFADYELTKNEPDKSITQLKVTNIKNLDSGDFKKPAPVLEPKPLSTQIFKAKYESLSNSPLSNSNDPTQSELFDFSKHTKTDTPQRMDISQTDNQTTYPGIPVAHNINKIITTMADEASDVNIKNLDRDALKVTVPLLHLNPLPTQANCESLLSIPLLHSDIPTQASGQIDLPKHTIIEGTQLILDVSQNDNQTTSTETKALVAHCINDNITTGPMHNEDSFEETFPVLHPNSLPTQVFKPIYESPLSIPLLNSYIPTQASKQIDLPKHTNIEGTQLTLDVSQNDNQTMSTEIQVLVGHNINESVTSEPMPNEALNVNMQNLEKDAFIENVSQFKPAPIQVFKENCESPLNVLLLNSDIPTQASKQINLPTTIKEKLHVILDISQKDNQTTCSDTQALVGYNINETIMTEPIPNANMINLDRDTFIENVPMIHPTQVFKVNYESLLNIPLLYSNDPTKISELRDVPKYTTLKETAQLILDVSQNDNETTCTKTQAPAGYYNNETITTEPMRNESLDVNITNLNRDAFLENVPMSPKPLPVQVIEANYESPLNIPIIDSGISAQMSKLIKETPQPILDVSQKDNNQTTCAKTQAVVDNYIIKTISAEPVPNEAIDVNINNLNREAFIETVPMLHPTQVLKANYESSLNIPLLNFNDSTQIPELIDLPKPTTIQETSQLILDVSQKDNQTTCTEIHEPVAHNVNETTTAEFIHDEASDVKIVPSENQKPTYTHIPTINTTPELILGTDTASPLLKTEIRTSEICSNFLQNNCDLIKKHSENLSHVNPSLSMQGFAPKSGNPSKIKILSCVSITTTNQKQDLRMPKITLSVVPAHDNVNNHKVTCLPVQNNMESDILPELAIPLMKTETKAKQLTPLKSELCSEKTNVLSAIEKSKRENHFDSVTSPFQQKYIESLKQSQDSSVNIPTVKMQVSDVACENKTVIHSDAPRLSTETLRQSKQEEAKTLATSPVLTNIVNEQTLVCKDLQQTIMQDIPGDLNKINTKETLHLPYKNQNKSNNIKVKNPFPKQDYSKSIKKPNTPLRPVRLTNAVPNQIRAECTNKTNTAKIEFPKLLLTGRQGNSTPTTKPNTSTRQVRLPSVVPNFVRAGFKSNTNNNISRMEFPKLLSTGLKYNKLKPNHTHPVPNTFKKTMLNTTTSELISQPPSYPQVILRQLDWFKEQQSKRQYEKLRKIPDSK